MKPSLIYAFLSMLIVGACGGSQPTPRPTLEKDTPAPDFAAAMGASLTRISKARRARLVYAVFGGGELADAKALQKQIVLGLHRAPPALRDARSHAGKKPPVPLVISSPVDAELPIDVKALAAGAGKLGETLNQASYVAFLRYIGPAHPGHVQVWSSAIAAALVASADAHIVVDLGLQKVYGATAWRKTFEEPDWLRRQIIPGAEKAADGSVTFFTRGMTRFGLPDLEETGVDTKDARQRFEAFQKTIETVFDSGYVKPGETRGSVRFEKCLRPKEAIESACVRVTRPKP